MTLDGKRILIAAGGTGGHINPAIAVAGYIREKCPDSQICFVGTADKMEARIVPEAGFEIRTIVISGFSREKSLAGIKHNIRTIINIFKASKGAKKIIRDFKPDLCIGFGGYVSGPVLRMAAKMGIPTAIHEQNAFPGVTNKALASKVDRVMLTVAEAEKYMKCKNKPVVTGLPVRGDLLRADRDECRRALGLDSRPLVLSMGGSLGAQPINDAVLQLIVKKYADKDCYFLHATGKACKDFIPRLKEAGVDPDKEENVTIEEYINIPKALPAADLVICRAGASSLSEFQALGKPAILIPSPYVAENHQYHNAMALVNKGAAFIIEEKDLTAEKLTELVNSLLNSPEKLESAGRAAKGMAIDNTTQLIYDTLTGIVR